MVWLAMRKYLIDSQGQFWPANSRELADYLGWLEPNDAFVDYVVRNIGYIATTDFGNNCRIVLHSQTVSSGAYAALATWLLGEQFRRVSLVPKTSDSSEEIVGDAIAAVQRLTDIIQSRDGANATAFLSKPTDVTNLSSAHPFRSLLELWRYTSNNHAISEFETPLKNLVDARYIVAKVEPCSSLIFHSVGPGVQIYNETWFRSTVGLRIQDQPNYDLGRWAAEAYRETIISNKPRFDDVDLIVKRPRATTKQIRYKRMLLPLHGALTGVMCVTLLDPTVRLRVGAQQIPKDIIE